MDYNQKEHRWTKTEVAIVAFLFKFEFVAEHFEDYSELYKQTTNWKGDYCQKSEVILPDFNTFSKVFFLQMLSEQM